MATFRKRGSKWQVQVRVQGQNAISRSFTFKTDAERWAREAEASIERNDFQSPAKELQTVSLDEKLERYERVVTAKKERESVGSIQTNRSKKASNFAPHASEATCARKHAHFDIPRCSCP